MVKEKNSKINPNGGIVAILYMDTDSGELEHLDIQRFGDTWTKPNAKYKIKDKQVQKSYVDAMSELPNKGASGLVLYETLKNLFGMPPEKKVIWTVEDVIKFLDLIESNNAYTLVRATRDTFPELYKFLTLFFEEGEDISHMSSGWTSEQITKLQELYISYIAMRKASSDEKLHYNAFFAAKDSLMPDSPQSYPS